MNLMAGVLIMVGGTILAVLPMLQDLAPLPDLLARFVSPMRSVYPVTRDDGLFDDVLAELDEVS